MDRREVKRSQPVIESERKGNGVEERARACRAPEAGEVERIDAPACGEEGLDAPPVCAGHT